MQPGDMVETGPTRRAPSATSASRRAPRSSRACRRWSIGAAVLRKRGL
jgi:hypothetical protein